MKIKKGSLHYKAYKSTYEIFPDSDDRVPEITTLCQYMGRLALAPFYWLCWVGFVILAFSIVVIPVTIIRGLSGQKPEYGLLDVPIDSSDFIPYQLPKIAGITIYPWYLVILIALGYFYYQYSKVALTGVGIVVAIAIVVVLIVRFFDSEMWNLIKTYYSDKKRKICRRIEFISDESGNTN